MPAPQVAVAVVSWNTRALLERCLTSLEPDADAGRAEVWVVDNASADGSAKLVRERFGWVKLIACEENLGFGPAVNRVAAETKTPWVAPANADIELEPGALATLLAAGERHRRAGAFAPRLVLRDGSTQHSVHPFPTLPFALAYNTGLAAIVPGLGDRLCLEGAWNSERERSVPWAIAAFLLLRRAAWDQVQGFSESQWMYAEDLDLGWRLGRCGWRTVFVPRAVVRHRSAAATSQAWGSDLDARWMASTYAWMLWRRGVVRTRLAATLNLLGAAARLAICSGLTRFDAERYLPRRDELRRWIRLHRIGLTSRGELPDWT
jgi:N-acetylglucosaminyl-diphospho-decaprenol L-rhamnosyltransferase